MVKSLKLMDMKANINTIGLVDIIKKKGVIVKPKLINSTSLYFFKSTLKTGTINKTERKVENNDSLRKSFQSWWKKISNR